MKQLDFSLKLNSDALVLVNLLYLWKYIAAENDCASM